MSKYLMAVVVGVLIVLAGVIIYGIFLPETRENISDFTSGGNSDIEVEEQHIENLDVETCFSALSYSTREKYCVQQVVALKGESVGCGSIQGEERQEYCQNGLAVAQQDVSYCQDLPDSKKRHHCFTGLAYQYDEPSYCVEITDDRFRNVCYYYLAQRNKDTSICSLMDPPIVNSTTGGVLNSLTDECYLNIFRLPEVDLSLSDCDNIVGPRSVNSCLKTYAIESKDAGVCDLVDPEYGLNTGTDQEDCIRLVAIETADPGLCDQIESPDMKVSCEASTTSAVGDLAGCDNFDNTVVYRKDGCIMRVAATTQDPSICEMLTVIDEGRCYRTMAIHSATEYRYGDGTDIDVSACELIPGDSQTTESQCYDIVATISLDNSFCDLISNQEEKEGCRFFVELESHPSLEFCGSLTNNEIIEQCYKRIIWDQRGYPATTQIL